MNREEAIESIKTIPLGSKIQLIKKNGVITEVVLASHEVEETIEKQYGNIVVPALPPALIVKGGTRFGSFRIEIDDIVKIAWIS
jgi:hypothetical protein